MRPPRYAFDSRLTLAVYRSGQRLELWGRTADISEGGVAATLSETLEIGEIASMQLDVGQKKLSLRAIVRFSRGHFCGFQFLAMSEEQRALIASVCERLRPIPVVKTAITKDHEG